MKNRKRIIMMIITGLIFLFPIIAVADVGPKPQLTITVKNPPAEVYYLDLLIEGEDRYCNISDKSKYDDEKLALLENYHEDGWHAGLVKGTSVPMWGNLKGVKKGDTMIHTFGYVGVPEDFKIIIITPENRIIVSPEVHRNTFQAQITYDYATGNVLQPSMAVSYLIQFLTTCIPTLLIEGVILMLFRFSLKQNLKVFLAINLITQIFLTASMGTVLLKQGGFSAFLVFIPLELMILVFEILAFSKLLRQHSVKRRVLYALTANVISAAAGVFLIWFEFMVRFF